MHQKSRVLDEYEPKLEGLSLYIRMRKSYLHFALTPLFANGAHLKTVRIQVVALTVQNIVFCYL